MMMMLKLRLGFEVGVLIWCALGATLQRDKLGNEPAAHRNIIFVH
jgi:hypothetical protein